MKAWLLLFACGLAQAQPEPAIPAIPWTLRRSVQEALSRSPELQRLKAELGQAELEEPLLLALTDPQFQAGYSHTNDRSPRAAPAFQGSFSRLETFETGLLQRTLLGTETKLLWHNERLTSPSLFRTLDPSAASNLSLELSQPLIKDFWGRPDKARRGAARARALSARWRWENARADHAARAARAHLELYFARRQLRVREAGVEEAERLVVSHRDKRRYGLVEASDLLQAEASLELRQTELIVARSSLRQAELGFRAALHQPASSPAPTLSEPEPMPEPRLEPEAALSRRPDLLSAQAARKAGEWDLRLARLDIRPDLSLEGAYRFSGLAGTYQSSWKDMSGWDHAVKTVGLRLLVPLTFRRERLLRRQAEQALEGLAAEERRVREQVERELAQADESWQTARRRVAAGLRLLELERRKAAAEESNFRKGRSTTDLMVRFRQDIQRAESELLRAQQDELAARIELARASGTLIEELGLEAPAR
ncbi:MAG: TolC family protein [Elusimicrobia bacterium]|nr:TolC family protein [Elusimicrobiota bacterium]